MNFPYCFVEAQDRRLATLIFNLAMRPVSVWPAWRDLTWHGPMGP